MTAGRINQIASDKNKNIQEIPVQGSPESNSVKSKSFAI